MRTPLDADALPIRPSVSDQVPCGCAAAMEAAASGGDRQAALAATRQLRQQQVQQRRGMQQAQALLKEKLDRRLGTVPLLL